MDLAIISDDRFQTRVLAGAAERRGWNVAHIGSTHAFGSMDIRGDAIIVDTECVSADLRDELAVLAGRVGAERIFLLVERIAGIGESADSLPIQGLQLKPFYPAKLFQLIEAGIPHQQLAPRITALRPVRRTSARYLSNERAV